MFLLLTIMVLFTFKAGGRKGFNMTAHIGQLRRLIHTRCIWRMWLLQTVAVQKIRKFYFPVEMQLSAAASCIKCITCESAFSVVLYELSYWTLCDHPALNFDPCEYIKNESLVLCMYWGFLHQYLVWRTLIVRSIGFTYERHKYSK